MPSWTRYNSIPGHLLTKAKTNEFSAEMINNEDPESFHLDENVVIVVIYCEPNPKTSTG